MCLFILLLLVRLHLKGNLSILLLVAAILDDWPSQTLRCREGCLMSSFIISRRMLSVLRVLLVEYFWWVISIDETELLNLYILKRTIASKMIFNLRRSIWWRLVFEFWGIWLLRFFFSDLSFILVGVPSLAFLFSLSWHLLRRGLW